MATVKLGATLPDKDSDYNGLDELHDALLAVAHDKHHPGFAVVGIIKPATYLVDLKKGGTRTPNVEFVRIEAALSDDETAVRKIIDRAYDKRTGQEPIPLFDLQTEVGLLKAGAEAERLREQELSF